MKTSFPCCAAKAFILPCVLLLSCGFSTAKAATNKKPILLSQATTTRAVAFESVTMKAEPFSPTATIAFGSDTRTRICIFAMDLELLSGEGANAFSSDVQDGTGKIYPLKVEYAGRVPDFPGITMIVVRLADEIGDVGDVLLRLNLHGTSSNRVRVAIGHSGGGPADDPGAVPTPAPVTPPPADAPLVPDAYTGPATDADTVRFLEQASWGPTSAEVARVKAMGFMAYLDEQFNLLPTNAAKGSNYPDLIFPLDDSTQQCPTSNPSDPNYNQAVCGRDNYTMYPIHRTFFSTALYGNDQLRQRVAFALHQILVVSAANGEINSPSRITPYLQALDRNAFGNYRTLLNEITLTPAMGEYLDMRLSIRTNPNENFGREVLQLFSIGTDVLNVDGTQARDAQGNTIPTYTQTDVVEFTRVFTGWNFTTALGAGITNYRDPMVPRGGQNHDAGAKVLLNGFSIPACTSTNSTQNIACAQSDMTAVMTHLANHPNVGPFLSKQLIQHLVTSNPSPAYVQRVAEVFNNDCNGLYPQGCTNVRGNLKLVVRAILLDPEARGDVKTDPNYGKLREPAQYITGFLRAFNVKSFDKLSTSDGVLGNSSTTDFTGTLDQPIYQPPTVFSYYQPGYQIPGTKLLGPAFGILSTTTTLRRANNINTLIFNGVSSNSSPIPASPNRPRGTSIDLANLQALAGNPADVVNALDALLLHGTMNPQMRTSIITALNAINDADVTTRNLKRAQTAVYLVATSSQYDIQR